MNNESLLILTAIVFGISLLALIASIVIRNKSQKEEALAKMTSPSKNTTTPTKFESKPMNSQPNPININKDYPPIVSIPLTNDLNNASKPVMPNSFNTNSQPLTNEGFKSEPILGSTTVKTPPPPVIDTAPKTLPTIEPSVTTNTMPSDNNLPNKTQAEAESINTLDLDTSDGLMKDVKGTDSGIPVSTTSEVDLSRNPWEEPITQNEQVETIGATVPDQPVNPVLNSVDTNTMTKPIGMPSLSNTPVASELPSISNPSVTSNTPELNKVAPAASPVLNNQQPTSTPLSNPMITPGTVNPIINAPIPVATIPDNMNLNNSSNLGTIKPEPTIPAAIDQPIAATTTMPTASSFSPSMPNLDLPPLGGNLNGSPTNPVTETLPKTAEPIVPNPTGGISASQQPIPGASVSQPASNFTLPPQ